MNSAEAEQARQVVQLIKEKRAVAAALAAGVEEYDEDKLRLNLEKAAELGVQDNVDKAYEMLAALITEKQYLYDNAIYQLQVLEEQVMQDIISRADGIHYMTPEIERIRDLLLNTPEEKFVQLQLKAAVANNDPARAIRITIRLKDLFFQKAGDLFQFEKFGVLRDRMEWASMKFLSFNKEELAMTMLIWTNNPIHASLTQLDSNLNKIAKAAFKNIFGYMGDRPYQGPELLAQELCQMALENAGIRDELYCQLVKQLTRNPDAQSVQRGWQLMSVFLETFPPLEQFQNYLEMFLRTNAEPKDRYVHLLHQAYYGGPSPKPPSVEEIQQIASGRSARQFNVAYTAEEKAAAKEALAFGGHGPGGGKKAQRPQMESNVDSPTPPAPSRAQPTPPTRAPPPGRPPTAARPPMEDAPMPRAPIRSPNSSSPLPASPPLSPPPNSVAPRIAPRAPPPGRPPAPAPAMPPPAAARPPADSPMPRVPMRPVAPAMPPPGRAPMRAPVAPGVVPPRPALPDKPKPRNSVDGSDPSSNNAAASPPAMGRGFALPPTTARPAAAAPRVAPRMPPTDAPPIASRHPLNAPMRIPPRPAAPPPKRSPWQVVKHPETGQPYYHNTATNEVQWDKPADFDG